MTEFPKASLVTEGYLGWRCVGTEGAQGQTHAGHTETKTVADVGLSCTRWGMRSVDLHLYVCACRRRGLRPRPVSLVHTCHRVNSTSEAGPLGGSRGALMPVAHCSPPLLHFIASRR